MKQKLLKISLALAVMLVSTVSFAQSKTVKGRVADASDTPLIGVAVMVKGNNSIGTETDADGMYTLPGVPANAVLVFQLIGMDTQEVAVGNRTTVDVVLNDSAELLEEMVVIGYGSIKKADLTGAVSVVDKSDYENKVNTSIADALQGLAAGVNVRSSGGLGDLPTVLIRGTSSLTDNTPLYIIDGIPTSNNIGFNVDDIESIQVLKDASAAAIYGSRAANGVIIITTKKGEAGTVSIDFSNQTSVQWNKRVDLAGRDEFIDLLTIAYNDGIARKTTRETLPEFWQNDTDWQDEFYKTGIQQKYDLAISGGSKDAQFRASFGHLDNTATQIGRHMRRETASINSTFKKGKVTFGESVQFGLTNNKSHGNVGLSNVFGMVPLVAVHDDLYGKNGWGYGNKANRYAYTTAYNVVACADDANGYSTSDAMYIRGSAWAQFEILPGLNYKLNLGANINQNTSRSWNTGIQYAEGFTDQASSSNASSSNSTTYVIENTLNYDKVFGKHTINAVLGQSYQTSQSVSMSSARQDLVKTAGGKYLENVSSGLTITGAGGSTSENRLISYFGRINYNYANKYLLQATVRADGSSRFAPGNQWGFFPSVSAGWRVSQEDFWNVSWMNDLKLRYSYGQLGSQNVGNYDYMSLINSYTSYLFTGSPSAVTPGQAVTELANNDISWETLIQHNWGVDMAFFNNKFLVTAEYYISKSADCLYNQTILRTTGATNNPVVNSATLSNRGIELSLKWRQSLSRDFGYSIGANFSHNKNRLDGLGYGNTEYVSNSSISRVGKPLGMFYLVKENGLFQSDEEAKASGITNARAGDVAFEDVNKDGKINTSDRQLLEDKSPWPGLEASLNFMLNYKNWSVQVSGFGELFKYTLNGMRSTLDGRSANTLHQLRSGLNWWSETNKHNDVWYPRPAIGYTYNDISYSTRFLERGDFFKFNSISAGYNWVPKGSVSRYIKSAKFSLTAQNMITLTKFSGLDPDFKGGTHTPGNYSAGLSNPYSIIFGLNVSF